MKTDRQPLKSIAISALMIMSMSLCAEYTGNVPKNMYGESALEQYCKKNPGAPECIDAE
jgi:hypothetical protein